MKVLPELPIKLVDVLILMNVLEMLVRMVLSVQIYQEAIHVNVLVDQLVIHTREDAQKHMTQNLLVLSRIHVQTEKIASQIHTVEQVFVFVDKDTKEISKLGDALILMSVLMIMIN